MGSRIGTKAFLMHEMRYPWIAAAGVALALVITACSGDVASDAVQPMPDAAIDAASGLESSSPVDAGEASIDAPPDSHVVPPHPDGAGMVDTESEPEPPWPECPVDGGACPKDCTAITARPYDVDNGCWGDSELVGCFEGWLTCPAQGWNMAAPDGSCWAVSSPCGALYTHGWTDGWDSVDCSDDALANVQLCP